MSYYFLPTIPFNIKFRLEDFKTNTCSINILCGGYVKILGSQVRGNPSSKLKLFWCFHCNSDPCFS